MILILLLTPQSAQAGALKGAVDCQLPESNAWETEIKHE